MVPVPLSSVPSFWKVVPVATESDPSLVRVPCRVIELSPMMDPVNWLSKVPVRPRTPVVPDSASMVPVLVRVSPAGTLMPVPTPEPVQVIVPALVEAPVKYRASPEPRVMLWSVAMSPVTDASYPSTTVKLDAPDPVRSRLEPVRRTGFPVVVPAPSLNVPPFWTVKVPWLSTDPPDPLVIAPSTVRDAVAATSRVCAPVVPPIVRLPEVTCPSVGETVTEYVPAWVMQATSAVVGTVPSDQFAPTDQSPPALLIQLSVHDGCACAAGIPDGPEHDECG